MTRSSIRSAGPSKQFRVFEFTEDEIEKESRKILRRFESPRSKKSSSTIDKYEFLRHFAQDTTIARKESLSRVIDVEDANNDGTQEKGQSSKSLDSSAYVAYQQCPNLECSLTDISADRGAPKEGICGLTSHLQSALLCPDKRRIDVVADDGCEKCGNVFARERTRCDTNGYETSDQIDVISDEYLGRTEISSSTSTSSFRNEVSSGEENSDCTSGAHEIDTKNFRVLLFPNVVIYGDIYCTKSKLTFSDSYIEVEGSVVNATKGSFRCQWPVEDIIKIECEWYLEVHNALVNILIKSRTLKGTAVANETSGIDLLKFYVYDPNWFEALEAIKSLDLRYKDMWFDISAVDGESEEHTFEGHISGTLITNSPGSFEDIVYPQGDPDAVLISERDIHFLRPESFINDTIIDFYIRYLRDQIQPEEQCRFHFFNCFFFRKLANIDKGARSTSGGRDAYERVQKWTKKVDLFGKDYIFIPVNFSFHWSLIVICHLGDAYHFKDEGKNSQRVPCILHMDSIKGSHRGLKSIFPSYLAEEWKERHGDKRNESARLLNLQFIPLEVPQQENSFDCGLFLLHYLELFLRQAPANVNPSTISKSTSFLSKNWFPPAEASSKRGYIRELLYSLQKGHSWNSVNCTSSQPSSGVTKKADEEKELETVKQTRSSRKPSYVSSSIPISIPREIDTVKETRSSRRSSDGSSPMAISAPEAKTSSSGTHRARVARCRKKGSGEPPDLILREEKFDKGGYDPKASKNLRAFMSPIMEVSDLRENAATISPLDRHKDPTKMVGEANTPKTTLFPGDDDHRGIETSRNEGCAVYIEDSDKEETVLIESIPESDEDSSQVQLNEDDMLLVVEDSQDHRRTSETQSPSASIEMISHFVIQDSLEREEGGDDDIRDSATSLVSTVVTKERGSGKGSVTGRSHLRNLVSRPLENRITKRPKTRGYVKTKHQL